MLRVKWKSLECMHLDSMYFRMSLQNTISLMGLFGYADAHGYFSLNDIQFWALMYNLTDMPVETITSYFFKLDCDYTGEMNFVEFQLLCTCMIAAKDRVTKEFLQRHFRMLVSIQDTGKRNYLPLMDFIKVGALMGWNLGTMDRIYRFWDRSFELERYRVRTDRAMTFILFAIDHEKATQARRRITCIKQFKRRWLLGLDDLIMDYFIHESLPPPPILWSRMTGTEPPFLKPMKETKEERGCCEYCFFGCCIFIILPWFLVLGLGWLLWKNFPAFRRSVLWILDALTLKPCRSWINKFLEKQALEEKSKVHPILPDSITFYNRNKRKNLKPKFRYLQKQREKGLFARIDPWEDSWLRAQLRLEQLEKRLLFNRIKDREQHELVLDDTFGVTALHWKTYVSKKPKAFTYKKIPEGTHQPIPAMESSVVVNKDDILRSKYPARFLKNFTAEEILKAEHELKEIQFSLNKGDKQKRRRMSIRETVRGIARRKQQKLNEDLRAKKQEQMQIEIEQQKIEEETHNLDTGQGQPKRQNKTRKRNKK